MHRRRVLAVMGAIVTTGSLGGCIGEDTDGQTTDSPPDSPSRTPETTETADPYVMSEGTAIVEVTVESGYEGEVVVDADCRDGQSVLSGGEHVSVERREHGETCGVSLTLDGDTVVERSVPDYESSRVTVTADGELEESAIVV